MRRICNKENFGFFGFPVMLFVDLDDSFDLSQLAGLSTIVYRKGTLECDKMVGLLNAAKIGCRELRRTQLWNNFFAYMSCLVGATIVTRGTVMNQNDIHLNAYT